MITVSDLKWELRVPDDDTSQDDNISNVLVRIESFVRAYCNNPDMDFSVDPGLDEVVLYIALRALNPETRGRAGLSATGQGISLNYLNDLPDDYKRLLVGYRKIRFT